MFTRTVTFTGAADIDAGLAYLRDTVTPRLREQPGFRAITASADRAGSVLGVLTIWATEADRDASAGVMAQTREQGQQMIGGELTMEHWEEVLVEVERPPVVGCYLVLRRFSADPSALEETGRAFAADVLPQIKAMPGFCAVRSMVNRQIGAGITGTIWADRAGAEAAAAAGEARRDQAAAMGVTFGELSVREIIYAELS